MAVSTVVRTVERMPDSLRLVLIRAGRTAVQTALAVLVASGTGLLDVSILRGAAVAGLAAGLAALQNGVEQAWPTETTVAPPRRRRG